MKRNLLNLMIKIFYLIVLIFIFNFARANYINNDFIIEDVIYVFSDDDKEKDKLYYKCYRGGWKDDGSACKVNIETKK